jgi:D-alanine-D-alanine ligase
MLNVAVIHGGPSLEHDISLLSGEQVLAALDRDRFRPVSVRIERDGAWVVDGTRHAGALEGARALRCDVAFLALHGPFGEDGTIQGFLETLGIPFTGSGLAGSAFARDKIRAKRLVAAAGVPGAPDLVVPPAPVDEVRRTLGFPVVVKNPHQGSTLGLKLAADAREYEAAVAELGRECPRLLVERREVGREFTAAVLETEAGEPECLPLVEIRARGGFFDFAEKYSADGAEEIVPAPLDEEPARTIRELALTAHRTLGLRGFSRSDFILRPDGSVVFLETNSIPGLTAGSLFPKAAAAAGIDFPALAGRLIDNALACERQPIRI